jgi:glycerophosphoryl diester phosphodiesterase
MTPRLPKGFLDRPFAHRGLHDAALPENSLAAFKAAVDAGYGIEMDIQMSADGQAMVFHDETLDRLTARKGPVLDLTAAELCQIPLRATPQTIPTLRQVLDLVAGRVPLLIEVKDQDGALGPDIGPLESAVAGDLERYDGPVAVMSFNPHSVMALKGACPDRPRGLITEAFPPEDWPGVPESRLKELAEIPDFERTGAVFISHDARDLAAAPVARLKARGVPVLCWTIKSPEAAANALKIADAITFETFLPPLSGA